MDKLISLAKRRGFIYQGSEIYGGLAGTWDYGPLGVLLKENIKALWLKTFRDERDDMYGLDSAIIMNPRVWEASGHVEGFSDPLVECEKCHNRFRTDHILPKNIYDTVMGRLHDPDLATKIVKRTKDEVENTNPHLKETYPGQGLDLTRREYDKKVDEYKRGVGVVLKVALEENHIACPNCGKIDWGMPRQFNMMFKTQIGAIDNDSSISYLRPETAQGIFVNFKNVIDSFHPKIPFGIAQIGKAFRNEISPRDFIFRVREMEQMEVEYFIKKDDWEKYFEEWREKMHDFAKILGIKAHELEVPENDRAHYSMRTIDFEFEYPFGQKELWGLAYRTDYDLKAHSAASGVDLNYLDEETGERFTPHVIEPSLGVDRTVLAVLLSAYTEDELGGESRVYLKLPREIAPIRAAVFPLLKNKPELVDKAREVYKMLKKEFPSAMFDDNGNIGKRYRRQDEIGTPFCITVDFDTLIDDTVTVRDRDSGEQKRVNIKDLKEAIG
ncbi:glycine--tRNA ligase [Candidatus Parcubacteria bacterium]|nr:glycine--tRNA ligase [Candidatus Parcubacteria bacterium]